MSEQARNIKTYVSAWNESSEDAIEQALAGCVTSDVRYCDPFKDEIQGVDALARVMNEVNQDFPGVVHELVGEPLIHHNTGTYDWLVRMADGKEIPGVDYVEFGSDGRISRVVSFTKEADWAP
ncbi:MAG: nuclear transport factor 2 family protein [Candidatus Saccharimonadales bacterium]